MGPDFRPNVLARIREAELTGEFDQDASGKPVVHDDRPIESDEDIVMRRAEQHRLEREGRSIAGEGQDRTPER